MRSVIRMCAAVVVACSVVAPIAAADMTMKGDLVAVSCLNVKAELKPACSLAAAKKGEPLAIQTLDNNYTITGDYTANKNAKLLDFIARTLIVTGEISEKDNGSKSINVKSIKLAPPQ